MIDSDANHSRSINVTFLVLYVTFLISLAVTEEPSSTVKDQEEQTSGPTQNYKQLVDTPEDLLINRTESSAPQPESASTALKKIEEYGRSDNKTSDVSPQSNATDSETIPSPESRTNDQRTARLLTTKFMSTLFVAYILICILLAIKHGPMFTY